MKHFPILLCLLLVGCEPPRSSEPAESAQTQADQRYIIIKIDGCSYIHDSSNIYNVPLVHHENCPNSRHQKQ